MTYNESEDVAVFMALRRLLNQWKDEPERLAVAAYAYENVLGYSYAAWELTGLSQSEATDRIRQALYRRRRGRLQYLAEGLVLGLRALAQEAEAHRLHEVQTESCVIECRELSVPERLERLRNTAAQTSQRMPGLKC